MRSTLNKNIIVAGTSGAWINAISSILSEQGWQITWPGQDIDIKDGVMFLERNRQNIEIQNIHQCLCDKHNTNFLSSRLPKFYDLPYPGPAEFIAKFDKPAVISGTCLSPFLDIWVNTADVVIDIRATEEEDMMMLDKWSKGTFAPRHVATIRDHHLSRYNQHLKLFPKVFTMTNSEVRDQRVDGLVRFLNSVF